jgi:hypothetical protein
MSTASDTSQSQIVQHAKRLRGRFAGRATRLVSVQHMADAVMAEAAVRQLPPFERKPRST